MMQQEETKDTTNLDLGLGFARNEEIVKYISTVARKLLGNQVKIIR